MGAVAARESLAGGQTVDDLMASVVGIAARGDTPFMTGFVLAEPRLIVADGWEGNVGQLGVGPVHIAAADGGRFTTDILLHVEDHPFGPMLLACPATLKVPGLRLNAAPVAPGSGVRIGVAAGPRVGLSSGAVATDVEATVDIAPIGRVDHLVRLECRGGAGQQRRTGGGREHERTRLHRRRQHRPGTADLLLLSCHPLGATRPGVAAPQLRSACRFGWSRSSKSSRWGKVGAKPARG